MKKMSASQEKEFRDNIKEKHPNLPDYLIDSHVSAKNKYLAYIDSCWIKLDYNTLEDFNV